VLALGVVALSFPVEWGAREARGLVGLAAGLAVCMLVLLLGVLALVVGRGLVVVLKELALATVVVGGIGLAAFGLPSLVLDAVPAALVGAALYAAALWLGRPRPLREAVAYIRGLA
jgi:hypothetical protein